MKIAYWFIGFLIFCGGVFQEANGQPWTFVNTGVSHTIIIKTTVTPTADGVPLTSGDYIGVFYDKNGTPACAGYELWVGSSNIAVSAFGDDATSPEKDGFANGEQFQWKVWRHGDGIQGTAAATYVPTDGFIITNTDTYASGGISQLASLAATMPSDVTAPPAPVGLGATPAAWVNTNSFSIGWTNPADPSGIAAAWYKLGSVPTSGTDGTRTTGNPFTLQATAQGGQPVYVWLEDGAGNKNHSNRGSVTLYYDATGPVNGTIAINGGATSTTSLLVTLNGLGAIDSWSGLAQMRFSNDNTTWSVWESYAVTKTNWDLSQYGGNSTTGQKTVYAQYKDALGNASASFSDVISYGQADSAPPPSPVSLGATPGGWTGANSFSVDWSNPADASGIAAAWYKMGGVPTSSTDGTRTTGKPFTVQATAQGGQPLYVWLEDGAGNKDHGSRSSATLYYDATGPVNGTIAINGGATSTTSLLVTLNGLGAIDSWSGLAQMRFSNNNSTWSSWEPYILTRTNWDLSLYGGTAGAGQKTVYVQYRDAVGNVSTASADDIGYNEPDVNPPPAPVGMAATPGSWTSTNSFSIDWTNPADPSGIAAAWYKAGSAPTSNTDGTRTTGKPFTVQATAQGAQPIYLWLEDGAGNKDFGHRNALILYYDETAPVNGTIAINGGAPSTTSLVITLNSLWAIDPWSGLAQMRFSNNNTTWSAWEPYDLARYNWDLSQYGGTSAAGQRTVYVQYKDLVGNVSVSFSDDISYCVTPPPVDLVATPGTWTSTNSFSVDWTNPAGPSRIAAAWYRVGSAPTSGTDGMRTTSKPFMTQASAQGGQLIYVWLEDSAGIKDENNCGTVALYYDATGPIGGTIVINNGATSTPTLHVTLNNLGATDPWSGLSKMRFSNNNSTWSAWEPYAPTRIDWDLSQYGGNTDPGHKTVFVQYLDAVGNSLASYSDDISYSPSDVAAPPAPVGLVATPGSWTRTNSFSVDWTNPTDPSGIAAAWYKVGSAPTSITDGIRTTSKPFTVQAEAEGGQVICVWLEDGEANKDYDNHSSSTLYYDASGPVHGTIAINGGATSTGSLVVTLDTLGAADPWSGVSEMRFSNNNSLWSDWEVYAATKSIWNLSGYGGNTTAGQKAVYVQYRDAAGNISSSFSREITFSRSGAPWMYTNTGVSHTVIIPLAAAPSIDGVPLTNGDYIGVFYDSSGTLACGGYEVWTGKTNVAVAAFGNDTQTPQKDGFGDGEKFKWKVWRQADSSVFVATAAYLPVGSLGGIVTDTNGYVTNGISALAFLNARATGVSEMSPPGGFALLQNYPNPFNPSTIIEFSLSHASHVTLEVYSLLGERVETLVDARMAAGSYRQTFNAERLPGGVYFYRLRAGNFVRTNKLLLLR